jgi:hypothetical protein
LAMSAAGESGLATLSTLVMTLVPKLEEVDHPRPSSPAA